MVPRWNIWNWGKWRERTVRDVRRYKTDLQRKSFLRVWAEKWLGGEAVTDIEQLYAAIQNGFDLLDRRLLSLDIMPLTIKDAEQ